MANPNLQKIIKLTSTQYNLLSNGGNITYQGITYTGLNDNYLYLIQDDSPDVPTVTSADKGKYLYTNASTGALEWTNVLRGSSATITAADSGAAKLTLKGGTGAHPGGVTLQTTGTSSTTANTITIPAKDGTMALTSDLDNYVKLTGNQTIGGTKTFSGKIANTYLTGGVLDTHPEGGGTIIGYYTNDWAYLLKRGYSAAARNVTQNTTIEPDECWFDTSPSYDYLSLTSTSDVVEIIIKGPSMLWTTRGGICFGSRNWRANSVKIEVGYTATNTGTASNPDSDIVWVTRINVTNQDNSIVFGNINGPTEAEGGHSTSAFSYMRLTLTNWNNKTPRIAQIFTFNTGSIGLHNAFLSKSGGNFYGSIWPTPSNTYDLGNNSNRWASVHATTFYENGTSLVNKYLGINATAKTANKLVSPNTRPTSANFSHDYINNFASQRLDISTSSMTTGAPGRDGFITTYFWDNSGAFDTQLFIPNKDYVDGRLQVKYRMGATNEDSLWDSTWKSIPYTSDLDNYTKKTIKLADNVDLDTVTSSGFYRLMNHTQAYFPHSQMIVSRGEDTIAQLLFPWSSTKMFVRTGNGISSESSGNWRDWKEVAFTDNIKNGVLTIQKNGSNVATFSANASDGVTANITVPTKVSELTNDSNFTSNTGTITEIKVNGTSKGTSGSVNLTNMVTFASSQTATVAGVSKTTYTYNQPANDNDTSKSSGSAYFPEGIIMGGTAASAGLVTRGICGVTTPDATTGACGKDSVYINYDGDNTYRNNRQLVIQAGEIGSHYGNNLYQYAAARGDAVKAYCDATYAKKTSVDNALSLTQGDNITISTTSSGVTISATDTNTWRPVVDNLTSTATDQSLSANQGKVLKELVDGKSDSGHTHTNINTAFVFNNNDMPEGSANLSATTKAHQISFYRNGLSVPYQMDNSNDGGILRCRGNSESNVVFELATWDDSGAGETIQFNYYPTTSQVTPTYSVTVPKKTGTIVLNTDSSSAGNAAADKVVVRNAAGSIQTEKIAVSSGTTTKATMQYNSTEDCIEFIFA